LRDPRIDAELVAHHLVEENLGVLREPRDDHLGFVPRETFALVVGNLLGELFLGMFRHLALLEIDAGLDDFAFGLRALIFSNAHRERPGKQREQTADRHGRVIVGSGTETGHNAHRRQDAVLRTEDNLTYVTLARQRAALRRIRDVRSHEPGFTTARREYYRRMPNPMDPKFTAQNPIVEAATRIRTRRDLGAAVDSATSTETPVPFEDAEAALRAFGESLLRGAERLNSILGKSNPVKIIRLERPLRLRVRFVDKRISLDLDDINQLVRIRGCELDGDYQFDPNAGVPALINLSKISTEAGYGEGLTASSVLKTIAQDAELPRPEHLDAPGPLQF
jgi:hypothetical protein